MAEEGKINVRIPELRDMAQRLAGLKEEFQNMGDMASHYHDQVGDERVAHQLGEFASNWSEAKEKLLEQLAQVAGYAISAAEAYEATEVAISDSAHGGSGSGG
jgi:uncharacterized protein YukE